MVIIKKALRLYLYGIANFSTNKFFKVFFAFYFIKSECCSVVNCFFIICKNTCYFMIFFNYIFSEQFTVLFLNTFNLLINHLVICNDGIMSNRFFPVKVYFELRS